MSSSQLPHLKVGQVATITGLSVHVLRVWERRYQAVTPARTGKGARLYSEAQCERLRLLAELVREGHSIGTLVSLPDEQLESMAGGVALATETQQREPMGVEDLSYLPLKTPPAPHLEGPHSHAIVEQFIQAILKLDVAHAEQLVAQAALLLDHVELLDGVMAPILREVGNRWAQGQLSIVHEHACTGILRRLLEKLTSRPIGASRGLILTGALTGERHELGSMMAGLVASELGFRVVYLGADCPPNEVALAAQQLEADAILLSFVCLEPKSGVARMQELFDHLDALSPIKNVPSSEGELMVVVGGGRAPQHLRVQKVTSLSSLSHILDSIRRTKLSSE